MSSLDCRLVYSGSVSGFYWFAYTAMHRDIDMVLCSVMHKDIDMFVCYDTYTHLGKLKQPRSMISRQWLIMHVTTELGQM